MSKRPLKSTTMTMSEARASFAKVLTRAQHGESVQDTRDGKPVAAIVSIEEFRKFQEPSVTPSAALREFLRGLDREVLRGPDPWKGVRDRSTGRDFRW